MNTTTTTFENSIAGKIFAAIPIKVSIDDIIIKLVNANTICTDFIDVKVIPKEFQAFITEKDIPTKKRIVELITDEIKKTLESRFEKHALISTVNLSTKLNIPIRYVTKIVDGLSCLDIINRGGWDYKSKCCTFYKTSDVININAVNTSYNYSACIYEQILKCIIRQDISNKSKESLPFEYFHNKDGTKEKVFRTSDGKFLSESEICPTHVSFDEIIQKTGHYNANKDLYDYNTLYLRKVLVDLTEWGFISPINCNSHGYKSKYKSFLA